MNVTLPEEWKALLADEFESPYFQELVQFVREEYTSQTCYPPGKKIFSAFDHCPLSELKVVIIGQDPYHGPGQANGLCFSVHPTIPHPPSLRNIFIELQQDIGKQVPNSGDLSHWAKQGVLLLNATLTVRAHEAGSHQKQGWETFTDHVIQRISKEKEGVIFLLWGGFAKKKSALINPNKHIILTAGHPSPLSANRGLWFGNKHFSQTNELLRGFGKVEIEW